MPNRGYSRLDRVNEAGFRTRKRSFLGEVLELRTTGGAGSSSAVSSTRCQPEGPPSAASGADSGG